MTYDDNDDYLLDDEDQEDNGLGFPFNLKKPRPLTEAEQNTIAKLPDDQKTWQMCASMLITIFPEDWASPEEQEKLLELEAKGLRDPEERKLREFLRHNWEREGA